MLGAPTPGQLASEQGASAEREGHGYQGAAPGREPGQAGLRLEGCGALGEEPALLVLYLTDDRAHQLHQLLAPAADHRACRRGRPAGARRLDRTVEPLETDGDERRERIESCELRRVVAGQSAEPGQEAAESRLSGIVRREVGRVPRNDVAAPRTLGVHQLADVGLGLT